MDRPALPSRRSRCSPAWSASRRAQGSSAAPVSASALQQPVNWTAAEDHRNMMEQLGIKALRPGPSGNENAPNHADYDESRANPFPNLPDPHTLEDGRNVTTAEI